MAVIELVFKPGVATQVEIDDDHLLFCTTGGARQADAGHPPPVPDQAEVVREALVR